MEVHRCKICNNIVNSFSPDPLETVQKVNCDICGPYVIQMEIVEKESINLNKLAAFLYYNKDYIIGDATENTKLYIIGTQDFFEKHKKEYKNAHHLTKEIVKNWYPNTFSEKVDLFLLMLHKRTRFMGQKIRLSDQEKNVAFFSDLQPGFNFKNVAHIHNSFLVSYLQKEGLITFNEIEGYCLAPKGYKRVDELQKKLSKDSKNVFVAMSFEEKMKEVREAIKNAIIKCGYIPRIMDEIEHNHQIVPEMLYEIRQAKFLIAELTGHNNGAYFEEGYALGYGKEVIQLCNNSAFGKDGHFDVKQVNTVLWDKPDDLEDKLEKRIKATID